MAAMVDYSTALVGFMGRERRSGYRLLLGPVAVPSAVLVGWHSEDGVQFSTRRIISSWLTQIRIRL